MTNTTDATAQLIQTIENGIPQTGLSPLQSQFANASDFVLGGSGDTLGTTANWVQILSTFQNGLTSVLQAAQVVKATAAVAELGTFGSFLSLFLGLVLAEFAPSQVDDYFNAFLALIQELENSISLDNLQTHWQNNYNTLDPMWSPIDTYLQDLAANASNLRSIQLTSNLNTAQQNAQDFINGLIPTGSPGNPFAEPFWEAPFDPAVLLEVFPPPNVTSSGAVAYGFNPPWFGTLPQPQTDSDQRADPRSMLPAVAMGLQAYLTIQMLANSIDSTQPTFQQFLNQYSGTGPGGVLLQLSGWLSFLWQEYSLAVSGRVDSNGTLISTGIVKTDIPSHDDILGWLNEVVNTLAGPVVLDTDHSVWWGGSSDPAGFSETPHVGNAWNGSYGAAETYPPFGLYPQAEFNGQLSHEGGAILSGYSCSSSYFVSSFDVTNMIGEFQENNIILDLGGLQQQTTISSSKLEAWVIPWVQNKVILGTMARWKAIYLINGYDRLWSLLQRLQYLAPNPIFVSGTMTLSQDNTIASGNWSARELFSLLNSEGELAWGIDTQFGETFIVSPPWYGLGECYSLFHLTQFLDNVASGNWGGPPSYSTSGNGPARPLGFRNRLTAAAV
jgi:hypothetical protein